jgi:hypothetical protein
MEERVSQRNKKIKRQDLHRAHLRIFNFHGGRPGRGIYCPQECTGACIIYSLNIFFRQSVHQGSSKIGNIVLLLFPGG